VTTALPAILGGDPAFPDRLPLVRPTIEDPAATAKRLEGILRSGMLTNGPAVRELEAAVCEQTGSDHAVAVSSCTAGLMLTYQALGVRAGGRVLLPSFTFAASAHAVVWVGADVDFIEVTRVRASADVEDLAARLQDGGPVAAISATHVYGHPAEVETIDELGALHRVPVVYDAAHALGSRRADRPIGGFGTAEVFSLSPTKVVVAGEGGVVTTADASLAKEIRLGRDYGNPGDYDCRFPGLNARMSELHAAVAIGSLAEVERHVDRRIELVDRFESRLAGVPGMEVIRPATGDRSTFKDLTLVLEPEAFGTTAAQLQGALAADRIDSRRYYSPPIHRQRAYHDRWHHRRDLPVTDALAQRVLSPPLWSHLSNQQLDRLCDAIQRIHEHASEIRRALPGEPA
jgi:dTDP-4-amino-4,6-dideoxygalactose transaminase